MVVPADFFGEPSPLLVQKQRTILSYEGGGGGGTGTPLLTHLDYATR